MSERLRAELPLAGQVHRDRRRPDLRQRKRSERHPPRPDDAVRVEKAQSADGVLHLAEDGRLGGAARKAEREPVDRRNGSGDAPSRTVPQRLTRRSLRSDPAAEPSHGGDQLLAGGGREPNAGRRETAVSGLRFHGLLDVRRPRDSLVHRSGTVLGAVSRLHRGTSLEWEMSKRFSIHRCIRPEVPRPLASRRRRRSPAPRP